MKVWNVIQLIFFPRKFSAISVQSDIENEKDKKHYQSDVEARIKKKRRGFLISFFIVLLIIVSSYLTAQVMNQYIQLSLHSIITIRLLSLSLVAWSVLSRLGYETETYKGQTLLEKTSLFAFKLFYCIGLFFAVFSMYLITKP